MSFFGHSNHDLGLEKDLPRERDLEVDGPLRPRPSSSSGVGDGNLRSFAAVARDRTEALVLAAV